MCFGSVISFTRPLLNMYSFYTECIIGGKIYTYCVDYIAEGKIYAVCRVWQVVVIIPVFILNIFMNRCFWKESL